MKSFSDFVIIFGGLFVWSLSLYFGEILWYWPHEEHYFVWIIIICLTIFQLALFPFALLVLMKSIFLKLLEKNNIEVRDEYRIDFVNVIIGSLFGPLSFFMLMFRIFGER